MSVFWLQPVAWWGLLALAIPVLIHLLAWQQSRRLLFPSLKFLRATRLAALRRRNISDWALLAIRMLILAAAVAALAAPVFVSADRRESWNSRVARAVVMVPPPRGRASSIDDQVIRMVTEERTSAFVSAVFTPGEHVADGLRDASGWLQRQAPASREIVIVGDLKDGALVGSDVEAAPLQIGLRFLPLGSTAIERRPRLRAIAETTGGITVHDLQLLLDDGLTTVEHQSGARASEPRIEVRAGSEHQPRVEAALRAVLAEGIVLHRGPERELVIEFADAPNLDRDALVQPPRQLWMRRVLEQIPEVRGGEEDGSLVVRAGVRGADPGALHLLARITRTALADELSDLEPRVIPASTLAAWSRTPGPVGDEVRPGDEGDRRIFWITALVLLILEQWIRRAPRMSRPEAATATGTEARVA